MTSFLEHHGRPPKEMTLGGRLCSLIDWGRHRAAYGDREWVVKVPLSWSGVTANENEHDVFRKRRRLWGDARYARCRMMGMLLVMERVETDVDHEKLPSWAAHIDCCQVGFNRKGELVAYDYGG